MPKAGHCLLVVMLAVLVPAACFASEPDRPMEREARRVRALLEEGRYGELEALEKRDRDLSLTLSDGQQMRAAFYYAVRCGCGSGTGPEKLEALRKTKARVDAWKKAYPESIAAGIAEADYYSSYAWAVRGEGSAAEVPAEAWPVYRENIDAAARILDAMPPRAKDDPAWYASRLDLLRNQSVPHAGYERLLDEALDRHPRYLPIYFEAATFYSPRWGGSNAQMKAFIDKAVARTRPFLGDTMYARLQWANWTAYMFQDGQADWGRMKAAFERILADYPDDWNVNNFGNFACMAYDWPTTMRVIGRLQGKVMLAAWGSMTFYSGCKDRASRHLAEEAAAGRK